MSAPRIALRVRISWGDYPLHDVVLDPPRSFTLGEGRDFELPEEALGAEELEWIRVEGERVVVRAATGVDLSLGWQPLALGERLARRLGAFVIDVSVEKSAPRPRFGWFGGRFASG